MNVRARRKKLDQLKRAGLCSKCETNKRLEGRTLCQECGDYVLERKAAYFQKRKDLGLQRGDRMSDDQMRLFKEDWPETKKEVR